MFTNAFTANLLLQIVNTRIYTSISYSEYGWVSIVIVCTYGSNYEYLKL